MSNKQVTNRRFKTEPVTAEGIEELRDQVVYRSNFGLRYAAERARRLLLHWWAAGHDPRRHVLRCEECEGQGAVWDIDEFDGVLGRPCASCDGTGRDEGKKL